jgi:hypothetical protein
MTLLQSFWAKVRVDDESGCWVWTGTRDGCGYGRIFHRASNRINAMAHRVAFEIFCGPITEETLDHLCRNRACVNPSHLEPVSHRENCLRGVGPIPENAAKTHCDSGHPFDEKNTYIRPTGHRDCRICTAKRQREYQARNRQAA